MFLSSDTLTVIEFSRKPAVHIKRLAETKRPEILTVNGKSAVVTQDAQAYVKMAELADYAESILATHQAMTEQGRALDVFTAEFEAERGICRLDK